MMENKKRNVSGNKHMKSAWVYRRIGDDEPIGEIILFKHHKDAKKKMEVFKQPILKGAI